MNGQANASQDVPPEKFCTDIHVLYDARKIEILASPDSDLDDESEALDNAQDVALAQENVDVSQEAHLTPELDDARGNVSNEYPVFSRVNIVDFLAPQMKLLLSR